MWRFYRYTGTTTGSLEPLEHIHEMTVENVAYFPRPSQLNDPIDCRPRMIRPSTVEIEAYLSGRGAQRHPGGGAAAKERRRRKEFARLRLQNPKTLDRLWERQAESYGILSLSKSKCNAHMWHQYAEEGRGVCIEFDLEPVVEEGTVDWLPFEVEYENDQPEMNILEFREPTRENIREFVRRSFRVKTRDWMVEEEVRVAMEVEADPPKVPIPEGLVTAVFLGPQMSVEYRGEILAWPLTCPVFETNLDEAGRITHFEQLR